jgi:hypothetical protein
MRYRLRTLLILLTLGPPLLAGAWLAARRLSTPRTGQLQQHILQREAQGAMLAREEPATLIEP